jgi:small GTP-binding protein
MPYLLTQALTDKLFIVTKINPYLETADFMKKFSTSFSSESACLAVVLSHQFISLSDVRVIFVGNAQVGKTSLVNRFRFGKHNRPPITSSPIFRQVPVGDGNEFVNLRIWDTVGQEEYRALSPIYYRDAQIACIGIDLWADILDKGANELSYWIESVSEHESDCRFVLVGTKMDLIAMRHPERPGELMALAEGLEIGVVFATSALNGTGVNELFETIARLGRNSIDPPIPPIPKAGRCCT